MFKRLHIAKFLMLFAFSGTLSAFALLGTGAQVDARSGDRAGVFDYYALVLSWSPTYCATRRHGRRDPQCREGRPYAFVLHGLWPQYERGWPENCRTRNRPWVPKKVISDMIDIMPSPSLIIHEYRKHGTCAGLSARAYYIEARRLYNKITIPDRYLEPASSILVSPADLEKDFLKANPKMNADMISISCGKRKRLREIRICFTRAGDLRPCGANESQKRLCRSPKIVLPPVRDMSRYKPRPL